jgi:putative transferase (TIGR04331 family)
MLKKVFSESSSLKKCIIIKQDYSSLIPNNFVDFGDKVDSDDWNEAIYSQLMIEFFGDCLDKKNANKDFSTLDKPKKNFIRKIPFFRRVAGSFFKKMRGIYKDDDFFFIDSLLPRNIELLLQIQLHQFPKIWSFDLYKEKLPIDNSARKELFNFQKKDEFLEVLQYMLPKHIPKVYVEGYKSLLSKVSSLKLPFSPKAIVTGNIHKDDSVKLWIAERVDQGVPLVVRQHGGAYGMCAFSSIQDHELSVSDMWLSWGWEDDTLSKKITPLGQVKYSQNNLSYNPKGFALMVELSMPRYSYSMVSYPVAGQFERYFSDQINFVKFLPEFIRSKMIVRLRAYDFFQFQKKRWLDELPLISIDDGYKPIQSLVKGCRIYIATYNATTFLESLSWNIPTIIFWDPEFNELNERAEKDFLILESVGIFHKNEEEAAKQLEKVWDDVQLWWESKEVQRVVKNFCIKYSRVLDNPVAEFGQTLINKYD